MTQPFVSRFTRSSPRNRPLPKIAIALVACAVAVDRRPAHAEIDRARHSDRAPISLRGRALCAREDRNESKRSD